MANVTVTVEEAGAGTDLVVLGTGRQAAADSKSLTLSTEDKTVLDAIETAVELIDDAIVADDAAFTPATTKVMAIGAFVDDTGTDSVDEGDIGAPRMSATRILYTQGAVAHDAADSGNPLKVGGKYVATTSAVTDGDRTDFITDSHGNHRVALWGPNSASQIGSQTTALTGVTASSTGLVVSSRNYLSNGTTLDVAVSGAGNVADGVQRVTLANNAPGVIQDDAAFTPGTTYVHMAGFEFDDSTPDSVNEGDGGAARMSSRREIYTQLRDAAGNERGANVNASGQLAVAGPVTNAGTFPVQIDGDALTALQLIDDVVYVDDTATHSTGSTKVLGIGMVATPTDAAVSANDIGMPAMSLNREMHVKVTAGGITSGTAGTPSADVVTVQGAASAIPIAVGGYPAARRTITFTTDTSAYASGDLIADTQQLDGFFRVADGTGMILDMTIFDKADQTAAGMFVLVHQTSTSMGTENSAPNISDANAVAGIIGVIPVLSTDWLDIGGIKVATVRGINMPVKAVSGTDDLYFSIVNSTGTPTFAADSLFASFGVALD